MKIFTSIIILFFFTISSFGQNKIKEVKNEVLITKTDRDERNFVNLYIKIKNKSKKSITILKPKNNPKINFDFFQTRMQDCKDIPNFDSGYSEEIYEFNTNDLVEIKPKSFIVLKLEGNYYSNCTCNNNEFKVQVNYDTTNFFENSEKELDNKNIKFLKERITNIKFESKIVDAKFK